MCLTHVPTKMPVAHSHTHATSRKCAGLTLAVDYCTVSTWTFDKRWELPGAIFEARNVMAGPYRRAYCTWLLAAAALGPGVSCPLRAASSSQCVLAHFAALQGSLQTTQWQKPPVFHHCVSCLLRLAWSHPRLPPHLSPAQDETTQAPRADGTGPRNGQPQDRPGIHSRLSSHVRKPPSAAPQLRDPGPDELEQPVRAKGAMEPYLGQPGHSTYLQPLALPASQDHDWR